MSSLKRFGLMALTLLPLSLSACGGEGWEMRKTNTVFPYGNQRTAGSGVEYVRASMMPAKGPVVETNQYIEVKPPEVVSVPEPAPTPAPEPVKAADPVFNQMQRK